MRHPNSSESLKTIERRSRYAEILNVSRKAPHCLTDRQIARWLGYSDMNAVRPRITELINAGYLTEGVCVKDEFTGKTVRTTVFIKGQAHETHEQLTSGDSGRSVKIVGLSERTPMRISPPAPTSEESMEAFRHRFEKQNKEMSLF